MKLRFPLHEIKSIAAKYEYRIPDSTLLDLSPGIQARGHLTKSDLQKICHWKAPRAEHHQAKNSEEYVREVSAFALSSEQEQCRIEPLTLLQGVSWPTASVILHFFHKDPYPILDFRSLWSLSTDPPAQYTFDLWREYVATARSLSQKAGVDMRTLDRALWQHSKESQGEK